MFESGVVSEVDEERAASYEAEWKAVHRTLREWAKQRAAIDAQGDTYLLEAEELHVFERLGYSTMAEYMVGELDFTRHAANERLRVSRELLVLPELAAAYGTGELCFSKVRELTRVVTPETEKAFLVEASGKDSHQVARMVSGLKRGDRPDAIPDPALVTRRVAFVLHAEVLGLLESSKAALEAALGRAPTDDELIIELCMSSLSRGAEESEDGPTGDCKAEQDEQQARKVPPPRARQLFLTCKHCARNELIVDGEALAIDDKTAARLMCDVELVGDADTDERTRVTIEIPSALRRKVFMRDRFCCVVPGRPYAGWSIVVEKMQLWYRGFWDVPRLFAVAVLDGVLVFESPFVDASDEYSGEYIVKLVSHPPGTDADEILRAAAEAPEVMRIAVTSVLFDETRRRTVRIIDEVVEVLRGRGLELGEN